MLGTICEKQPFAIPDSVVLRLLTYSLNQQNLKLNTFHCQTMRPSELVLIRDV